MTTASPTADLGNNPLPPALADAGRRHSGPSLSMVERRLAWAQHRREMTRLVTAKADWVPVLIFASILMTPEARIDLGGFTLFPYRIALILAIPALYVRVAKQPVRISIGDVLVFLACIWMFIATSVHYPVDVAFKTGGATTLDSLLAYTVGRIFFRNALDLRRFLYRITPLVVIASVLMIMESISHQYIVRPFVSALTGNSAAAVLDRTYEIRNGFLRALGPFQHPIAAGLFFGTLLPLYVAADLPRRRWIGAVACIGGVFGWSSAGIASLTAGLALGFYDIFQRKFRIGWLPVVGGIVVMCATIQAIVPGGLVRTIIRYASLNPQTGYFRLLIFQFGWADVERYPWFGIGYFGSYLRPDWMRTDSVDNFWLLQALRYGQPGMYLMLAASLTLAVAIGLSRHGRELGAVHGRRMATGLCISITVLLASIISVAPWAADMAWFMILLGMAGGMSEKKVVKLYASSLRHS